MGAYARGRNVLNLFCYTGGFSIYALNGGAKSVESVDSSAKAMSLVDRNVALNGFENHVSHTADAIEFLSKAPKDKFDMIIVDPPAFAKHRGALKNALRAYQRLNAAAISKVASGSVCIGRIQRGRRHRQKGQDNRQTKSACRPFCEYISSGRGVSERPDALRGVIRAGRYPFLRSL